MTATSSVPTAETAMPDSDAQREPATAPAPAPAPAPLPPVGHLDRHGYLFGHKLAASLSPLLHGVVYDRLAVNWGQVRLDSADIPLFLRLVQHPRFYGASVTMPNKVAILPHLDRLSPEAAAIGACNTVYLDTDAAGRRLLCGANTDTVGVRDAFTQNLTAAQLQAAVHGRPGLVVGSGGAARSAIYALRTWLRVTDIYLVNRDAAEVHAVVRDLRASGFATDGLVHVTSVAQAQALAAHAAPGAAVGCVPDFAPRTADERLARDITEAFLTRTPAQPGTLLEMCYNPSPYTALGALAERAGWRVILGTEALIYQGLEQDRYWTGRALEQLPVQDVKRAIAAHLQTLPKM